MKITHINEDQFIQVLSGSKPVKVAFDIETAPLPRSQLAKFYNQDALELPPEPGPFDPTTVKYGNIKDVKKKAAKLAQETEKWNQKIAAWPHEVARLRDEHWAAFEDKAALSAVTGQVIAIGYGLATQDKELKVFLDYGQEPEMLINFWELTKAQQVRAIAGHNIAKFDIPFLTRRTWAHHMIPFEALNEYGRLNPPFKDTYVRWQCGDRSAKGKLDDICAVLGIPGKLDGVTGADFAELYREDKELADKYLTADVVATFRVAKVLKLI